MNNKIGLLNFHYSNDNYGAVLQAAALANVIAERGYNVEHINYIRNGKKKVTIKNLVIKLLELMKLKELVIRLVRNDTSKIIKHEVSGSEVFEEFRQDWVKVSRDTYYFAYELDSIGSSYHSVIVGSDQVWRLREPDNEFAHAYFLKFLPKKVKKIAYAASFGVDYWVGECNQELTNDVKSQLKTFHSISVREISGIDICKNTFDVNAEQVLDPTLLRGVQFFDDVISKSNLKQESDDIIYYKLDLDSKFFDFIEKIEGTLGSKSSNIYYRNSNDGYKYFPVPEWLGKIKNCKLIVTDSFHCVCFAILFNKDFICLTNKDRGLARLDSLLGMLGLTDRLFDTEVDDLCNEFDALKPIDYDSVNEKLEQLRLMSYDFLFNHSLAN